MQRKALKQLNKVTQWTSERVFHGEKTELSREFTDFEQEIDVKRLGIERLHATSMPYFENITKVKPTADPYPPGKKGDKMLTTEALGLVMIDYGSALRDDYGDALSKYGRARCKLAIAQQEFGGRLNENYIAGMERSLESVNDYKTFRKKLDSRRLALDAATARLNGCKKEKERVGFEAEVELAKERFDEIEEETFARMQALQNESEQPFHELSDLLEAELEYHARCKEVLEELRDSWPSGHGLSSTTTTRPRANTASSARSIRSATSRGAGGSLTPRGGSGRAALESEEDEDEAGGRHRSGSTSSLGAGAGGAPGSAKKEKKGFMGGFGSFGKKSATTMMKPRRDRDAQMLNSTDEEDYAEDEGLRVRPGSSSGYGRGAKPSSPRDAFSSHRTRSGEDSPSAPGSAYSPTTGTARQHTLPPALRRMHTSPPTNNSGRYVKALYDYATSQPDELSLRVGQIVEVKSEISADWYAGESEGRAGMFPAAYCEAYVPSPVASSSNAFGAMGAGEASVPLPPRRLPPGAGGATTPSRTLPPLSTQSLAPPARFAGKGYDYNSMDDTTGSEGEGEGEGGYGGGFDDGDHHATASLSGGAQSPATASKGLGTPTSAVSGAMGRSRSSTVTSFPTKKGPAPPPPPSRRSASSTNVLAMATSPVGGSLANSPRVRERAGTTTSIYNGRLGVPPVPSRGRSGTMDGSSPEGSPFAGPATGPGSGVHSSASSRSTSTYGQTRLAAPIPSNSRAEASPFGASGDEFEDLTDDDAHRRPAAAGAGPGFGQAPGAAAGGMTRAMSGLKLPSATDHQGAAGGAVGECRDACGCDEFKQNLFKPKGNCASCYHVHES